MADIASRCVTTWNDKVAHGVEGAASAERGLIALAFDQRNHGTRLVHKPANESWRGGNATHAQDMFSVMAGTVSDNILLM